MLTAILLTVTLYQKPQIEIGKPVPDVPLVNMDGKPVRLSNFRGKKLILFNWASC